MSSSYKIKDVADHSGFTAATLRYYEEIGLLPEPTRTSAGYRVYDDRSLERLAFIARAKQLGCTLKEVGDLVIAWDGGECGPVQDNLRTLVADKHASAQKQIAELTTLTNDLAQAATILEAHRPEGPCDDRCGCISDPGGQVVTFGKKPEPVADGVPIACTLAPASVDDRLADWKQLLTHAVDRRPLDNGWRVTLEPATPSDELMRLVSAEQDCCQFFEFAITVDTRGTGLEVRSSPDALPILNALFGGEA